MLTLCTPTDLIFSSLYVTNMKDHECGGQGFPAPNDILLLHTVWSESSPFAGRSGYVCFHGNICHAYSGVSGGGGRKHSCGIRRGGLHLLLHVFLCVRMGVSQVSKL